MSIKSRKKIHTKAEKSEKKQQHREPKWQSDELEKRVLKKFETIETNCKRQPIATACRSTDPKRTNAVMK